MCRNLRRGIPRGEPVPVRPLRIAMCLSLFASALCGTLHASPVMAATHGADGTVAFTHIGAHGATVWEVGLGGRGLLDVIGGTGTSASDPTWSPEDGAHIAFVESKHVAGKLGPGDLYWMTPHA